MKVLSMAVLSVVFIVGIGDIAEINRLKKEAEQAYLNGNFSTAINHYHTLLDSFHVSDENIKLNLAHAYLQNQDTAAALRNYQHLANSDDRQIKSVAQQQMGVVANQQQKLEKALQHFKEALKADPSNEEARYNYELIKKKLQEQQQNQEQEQDQEQNNEKQEQENQQNQEQQQDQQQKDQQQEQQQQENQQDEQQGDQQESEDQQQQQNEQQQEQNEGEQEEGESEEQREEPISPTAERLEEMNMSEEKARMILEAMRNNELQYIQQNRRKGTKPPDRNKPDW